MKTATFTDDELAELAKFDAIIDASSDWDTEEVKEARARDREITDELLTPQQLAKRKRDRDYYQRNKERINARNREYSSANREKIKAYQKDYRTQKAEDLSERKQAYNKANRERIQEYNREYYASHKELLNARSREYYYANRDSENARTRKWREEHHMAKRKLEVTSE